MRILLSSLAIVGLVLNCVNGTSATTLPTEASNSVQIAARQVAPSNHVSSSLAFYKSLAQSVTALRGRAIFYFNDCGGAPSCVYETPSRAAGGNIDWRISAGTSATAVVDYEKSHLVSASLNFSKPVHLWLHQDQGSSFSISHISYDSDGHLIDDDSKPDNPSGYHYAGATRTHRILEFTTDPAELLLNNGFTNVQPPSSGVPGSPNQSIRVCDQNDKNCQPTNLTAMFYEIDITGIGGQPGLAATLGPVLGNDRNLTLIASQDGKAPTNSIDVGAGSTVAFDKVQYYTDDHFLNGRLVKAKFNLTGGQLGTSDTLLRLGSGSTFGVQDITFTHDPTSPTPDQLETDHGTLVASLAGGSTIDISQGADPTGNSYVTTRDTSTIALHNVDLKTKDDGRFQMSWDNTSSETLEVLNGRVNIGPHAFVNLGAGSLTADINGQWVQGSAPTVSSGDLALDATITGGSLDINKATELSLGAGHIIGQGMTLDSSHRPILTGPLSTFTASIAPNSQVTIPGGFSIKTSGNATLSADQSSTGLTLTADQPYPLGQYILTLPFSKLDNAGTRDFELVNGLATFPIEALADGTVRTPAAKAWTFNGTLLAQPNGASQPLSIALSVADGRFDAEAGANPTFKGTVSGAVLPGLNLTITTDGEGLNGQPSIADHPDMAIYPITANLTIPIPAGGSSITPVAVIPPTSFRLLQGQSSIDALKLTIPFVASFPKGKGEHETYNDPNSADGTHGDSNLAHDAVHNWQEVMQDKNLTGVGPAACRFHAYIGPTTHSGTMSLSISLENKALTVGISQIQLSDMLVQGTDWDRDGCNSALAATIVGVILGALTVGVGGAVVAGGVTFVVGHAIDNRVDALISDRIGTFIAGYNKQWSIPFEI